MVWGKFWLKVNLFIRFLEICTYRINCVGLGEVENMGKNLYAPKWVQAFFHSFSQVVLVQNMMSGALILAAFFVFSFEANNWNIVIVAIIAAIVGNVTAKILRIDDDAIAAGLCGFNPVLVGLAAAIFFVEVDVYIIGILGSILVIPTAVIINGICSRFGVPGFTMPFITMTWFFMLVSFQIDLLTAVGREGALVYYASGAVNSATIGVLEFENVLIKGIGQIYFLDSIIASLMILVAFAIDRWHLVFKIAAVTVVSVAISVIFGADIALLNGGLFTYNVILVLMGMETFSKNKDNIHNYVVLVFLGVVLVALVDYALPSLLMPFALPRLTFPFVFVAWALLYFEQHLSND